MTDNEVSRRTVLKASAWSVPVIAVAAAVPAAAASTSGLWSITNVQAEFWPTGGIGGFDGFALSVSGDVTSLAGALPAAQAFTLITNASDAWDWYYPADQASFPISTSEWNLSSLDATTVSIIAPDGTMFGPYSIDRSALPNP